MNDGIVVEIIHGGHERSLSCCLEETDGTGEFREEALDEIESPAWWSLLVSSRLVSAPWRPSVGQALFHSGRDAAVLELHLLKASQARTFCRARLSAVASTVASRGLGRSTAPWATPRAHALRSPPLPHALAEGRHRRRPARVMSR